MFSRPYRSDAAPPATDGSRRRCRGRRRAVVGRQHSWTTIKGGIGDTSEVRLMVAESPRAMPPGDRTPRAPRRDRSRRRNHRQGSAARQVARCRYRWRRRLWTIAKEPRRRTRGGLRGSRFARGRKPRLASASRQTRSRRAGTCRMSSTIDETDIARPSSNRLRGPC